VYVSERLLLEATLPVTDENCTCLPERENGSITAFN